MASPERREAATCSRSGCGSISGRRQRRWRTKSSTGRGIIIFSSIAVVGCSGPVTRDLEELAQQDETFLDPETMEPYSGPVFAFFPGDTKRILLEANLEAGRLDGQYKRYYATGQLRGTETYSRGVLNGARENFYVTGELEAREGRKNGRLEGPFERFYKNGQLATLATYRGGYLYGLYEVYDEDGQLHSGGRFEHNEPCGRWIEDGSQVTYPPCPASSDSKD